FAGGNLAEAVGPARSELVLRDGTEEDHRHALALRRVDDGLGVAGGFLEIEAAYVRFDAQHGRLAQPHAVQVKRRVLDRNRVGKFDAGECASSGHGSLQEEHSAEDEGSK